MAHMMTSGGVLATAVATAALAVLATGPASARLPEERDILKDPPTIQPAIDQPAGTSADDGIEATQAGLGALAGLALGGAGAFMIVSRRKHDRPSAGVPA
jgi:hypothetical protein